MFNVHTIIDGFTITNGSAGHGGGVCCLNSFATISNNVIIENKASDEMLGLGGGIYCYDSTAVIQNNIIRGNNAQNIGGGIYCDESAGPAPPFILILINNQIDHNTAPLTAGAICCTTACSMGSNTIVENISSDQGACAVWVHDYTKTSVFNNIIAFNISWGIGGTSGAQLTNNDVFGNTRGDYVEGLTHLTDISEDPEFAESPKYNYHLQPNSLCVDAGTDTVQPGQVDMDGQDRLQGEHVDIGADESDGCGWYSITFSADPDPGQANQLVTVTANVQNWYDQDVGGVTVHFSVAEGTITEVNGTALQPPATIASGETDPSSGNAVIKITRPDAGKVTLTAQVSRSCGAGEGTTESREVVFQVNVGFFSGICYTGVSSYIQQFLSHLGECYPWIHYQAITATSFSAGDLTGFSTLFLVLPRQDTPLGQDELTALLDFVGSGHDKRIVLVGDSNPDYSSYNARLNTVAAYLGMDSRFSNSGDTYDNGVNYSRLCTVNASEELMQGVDNLWDMGTSPFGTIGSQARALAYIYDIPTPLTPWILREDTADAGSRVLIHDSSVLSTDYGCPSECTPVPNRNCRFIYNLCTMFPQ